MSNRQQHVSEEERFFKNSQILGAAIQEGINKLYNSGYKTLDPGLVAITVQMISNFDKHLLIEGFIKSGHKECWNKLKERNETFFIENASSIFSFLPLEKINLFKDLFYTKNDKGEPVISYEFRTQIWDLLDSLVKISIKYVHKGRKPTNGKYVSPSFFQDVELAKHARTWEIKLEMR